MAYAWITFDQLTTTLLGRLQDSSASNTTRAEAKVYITEALRVMNALTAAGMSGQWSADYQLDFLPGDEWKSLNTVGSPRHRTVTDADVQTQMEYMLLEPPTGLTWTGTAMFSTDLLSKALQYRRDELLQLTGVNPLRTTMLSPINSYRTFLSDSTLDIRRVRWIPDSTVNTTAPYALSKGDTRTADAYGDLLMISSGTPDEWRITADSSPVFDVSCSPNSPGHWDLILLYAEDAFVPPTPSVMGLPDDWCWVAMYGALADLLANSPEATDSARAQYCLARYEQGKKAMMAMPWLLRATVANLPVDTPSFLEMDSYAQNWENTWPSSDPHIVVGGVDLVALAPFVPATGTTVSSVLTVIGNAPVGQASPIQLTRDGVDQVLNYAQHLASFKLGGMEFNATIPLLNQFEQWCRTQNTRYAQLGVMRYEMLGQGTRALAIDPRFREESNG